MRPKKKLIEVALPLEAINEEGLRRKQKAPKGWPTSFHKWWAQRPLAAARAVIFAQMVDDPSEYIPELLGDPKLKRKAQAELKTRRARWQEAHEAHQKASAEGVQAPEPGPEPTLEAVLADHERFRLFDLIEELVKWDNTTNERVLQAARDEIWQSWRRTCAENADDPQAKKLFDRNKLPAFHDPFAGSGSIPLSAQWLGIESYASDLNPVAVLINKAMIEIPPKFAGRPPVNPGWQSLPVEQKILRQWKGAEGLAEDVRYYGKWLRAEAEKRIGHLYPKVEVTAEAAKCRPDLTPYVGKKLTVVAWLWARTVRSPDPAFNSVEVPLATSFLLSSKEGKEVYVEPVIEESGYSFEVRVGKPKEGSQTRQGTAAGKWNAFRCLMSQVPISYEYIRNEATQSRLGQRLMATVVEAKNGRLYLSPTREMEEIARNATPTWKPDLEINYHPRDIKTQIYGLTRYGDLFTSRQLVALTTVSDLVQDVRGSIEKHASAAEMSSAGGWEHDAAKYADALCIYLACVLDRMVYYGSSLTSWLPKDNALRDCMPRQALAMTWDYAECNPLGKSSGDILTCTNSIASYLDVATPRTAAFAYQQVAQSRSGPGIYVLSTDPPYYDNIGYADLSDYFYVWLRRTLKSILPDLFSTLAVPKAEELVATPYRHGSKENAEEFFLQGMREAMRRMVEHSHPAFPATIYYAFKQTEEDEDDGATSTGWETFLQAVIDAGFTISGTWPMRTEGAGRMMASKKNALASSIVLVCRERGQNQPAITRREYLGVLEAELSPAMRLLQVGNIAPVDLAQAAIGPGMAVFTRYSKVLDAEGNPLTVKQALGLINEKLDEVLASQEGDFDADTRWAVAWFEQQAFQEGEYGVAEVLSKAKVTSIVGLVHAGIVKAGAGKVRLLKPEELASDWDPVADARLTAWETVHQLIRVLECGGESAAAVLAARLGARAEPARELAYRLYTICERKKRAQEALSYNALVQSWPEIQRLAQQTASTTPQPSQGGLFN